MEEQDGIICLKDVRLSYPHVFTKANFKGKETKYEATFILDKVKHKDLIALLKSKIQEELTKNKSRLSADKICMRDGDDSEKPFYHGAYFIKASEINMPTVVDRLTNPIVDPNAIYGGCYVNAEIRLWFQNNDFGKRINANLNGIQFLRDGEVISDRERTECAFEVYDEPEVTQDESSFLDKPEEGAPQGESASFL